MSLFLQLYKMKLATAGEMALMVTDRIKSKQILHNNNSNNNNNLY